MNRIVFELSVKRRSLTELFASFSPTERVEWKAVSFWSWDTEPSLANKPLQTGRPNSENCGICTFPFDSTCETCKIPGDNCPLMWGQCGHVFHMHCILKWLQGAGDDEGTCPMDRKAWVTKV